MFLWISVLPNRLGQERGSEESQTGSSFFSFNTMLCFAFQHISVGFIKCTQSRLMKCHSCISLWRSAFITVKRGEERGAGLHYFTIAISLHLLSIRFNLILNLICCNTALQWCMFKDSHASVTATLNSRNPQSPNSCHLPPAQWNKAKEYHLLFTRALMMN